MQKRILVVDDEVGIRESLEGILRDEGYDVDVIDNGEDCIGVFKIRLIRLFFLMFGYLRLMDSKPWSDYLIWMSHNAQLS